MSAFVVSNELFNELKQAAIEIWRTYDDTYGYASKKIAYVESLKNIGDNYGTFIGMFDDNNQHKLYASVSPEAKELVLDWTGGRAAL